MQAQNRTCRTLRGRHPTPTRVVQRKVADQGKSKKKGERRPLILRENRPVSGLSPCSVGGHIRNPKAQLRAHTQDKGEISGNWQICVVKSRNCGQLFQAISSHITESLGAVKHLPALWTEPGMFVANHNYRCVLRLKGRLAHASRPDRREGPA